MAEAIVCASDKEDNLGERYLVGKDMLSIQEFNEMVSDISGVRLPRMRLPDAPWDDFANSDFYIQGEVWYSVRVEASGTRLRVFVDDSLRIDVDDDRARSGNLSLNCGPDTIAHFDDIRVTELER